MKTIVAHMIPAAEVLSRFPHVANFKPTQYAITGANEVPYFIVNDIKSLISEYDMRVLTTEVTSRMVSEYPVMIGNRKKYLIKYNSMNGLRRSDVISEDELVDRLNLLNRPDGGSRPISYYKDKFPDMFDSLFVETTKPLHKPVSK